MPRIKYEGPPVNPTPMLRPVMAIGFDIAAGPRGTDLVAHAHPMAQMIYMARGLLTCEVSQGLWIVPPGCAVWIPGGIRHDVKGFGSLEVFSLLVQPTAAPTMPGTCCTISVSPLLRELLVRCAGFAASYPDDGAESRLATVLLDELAVAPLENLHLPMPADGRLRRIADDPSDRATVDEWARHIGVSERTLSRLVLQETGMSFGRWRQQFHISLALQWLSQGTPVQSVAEQLGYESASSFVFMFRKVLGTSPAKYMTKRLAASANAVVGSG